MLDEIVVTASRLPAKGMLTPEQPELTWEGFRGRLYGIGQFITDGMNSTASLVHYTLYQMGNLASLGVSHHTQTAQQVWARQQERGQAIGQVLSDPLGAINGYVAHLGQQHAQIAAYEAASRYFDADALRARAGLEVGTMFVGGPQKGLGGCGDAMLVTR